MPRALHSASLITGLFALSACAGLATGPTPETASDALAPYYARISDAELPMAGPGVPLPPESTPLTRILVASCIDEEKPETSKALESMARQSADLVMMIGDNSYGDRDGRSYVNNDPDLMEVRESFADLAARPDFQAVRQKFPMMVAWDDHDYGANDAGREFPFKALAERIHERFWGLENTEAAEHKGTYYAKTFGPDGQRTQIIMLDTRYFRSALTPTDDYGAKGKERYLPSADPDQDMLGDAQWAWLESQLQQPADLRLIVSSIQVLPTDGHGWEAWLTLPKERDRLYATIRETGAKGVVFVSGDRHSSFLYRKDGVLPYPAYELTASSINVAFAETSPERDSAQIGAAYPPENFGGIDIDWAASTVRLSILTNRGTETQAVTAKFR